jgi:ribonuclease Z
MVNDIFITHLHVDHYGELPYIYRFSAWSGRWKPRRVTGPSGRTPKDGTKAMVEGMKAMTHWHTESFNCFPIGDGYEVEVNEFDYQDDNGICYDKDGVVIQHWRRAHGKDGASAYRLDWNGLSFVWTGDGRPNDNTAKFSKGVDVFVTELQPDTMNIQASSPIPATLGPVPRNVEVDPKLYYPPDLYRKPDGFFPKNFKIDLKQMLRDKVMSKVKSIFGYED